MTEMMLYRTSDLYFSSYLCAIDLRLETTEKDDKDGKRKVIFVFSVPKKDLDRLKAGYFGGSATVKANKLIQAIRSLKSMCYI